MRAFKIYPLSNFQMCNAVLLTVVTMVYITSPELIYNTCNCKFLPFDHLHLFCPSPLPASVTKRYQYDLSIYEFCFLDYTHKWNYTVFIFLWLTSLSIMLSKFIHVFANVEKLAYFILNLALKWKTLEGDFSAATTKTLNIIHAVADILQGEYTDGEH